MTPLVIFMTSRAVTIAVAFVVQRLDQKSSLIDVLMNWDGGWYASIAEHGYSRDIPTAGQQSNLGFFPGFPLAARAVAFMAGVEVPAAGVIVSTAGGFAATIVLWYLMSELTSREVAIRNTLLFSFFPGSFVFSTIYSEGLFLAFATLGLYLLIKERWILAGLAIGAAGGIRPTGIVLVACFLLAVVQAVVKKRAWTALLALPLAPSGMLAYSFYLRGHTGDLWAWSRAAEAGWGNRFDFGARSIAFLGRFVSAPLEDFNMIVHAFSITVAIAGFILLFKWRPPPVLSLYALGIIGLTVSTAGLTLTPRGVLSAFPIVGAFARQLEGWGFSLLVASSAMLMTVLLVVQSASYMYTP